MNFPATYLQLSWSLGNKFNCFVDGTPIFSCETEYVDIYSELESPHDDLLTASFGGRYCGTVSPYVRIR